MAGPCPKQAAAPRPWSTSAEAVPWVVAVIAVLATVYRLADARYSLWFDEQASMFFARQPLAQLWSGWMVRETNPPLYYSLLKEWIGVFGDSSRAVRGLSIAAGAGGIAMAAILTRQVYGRKAAVIGAALTALSAQQFYYSLQTRAYELVFVTAAAVLISLVAIERSWRRDRAWNGGIAGYAIGCTVAIYLHTTMFLLPLICSTALVIVCFRQIVERPGLVIPLALANLVVALTTSWWLHISLQQMLAGSRNVAALELATPTIIVMRSISTLFLAKATGSGVIIVVAAVGLIATDQAVRSCRQPATKLLLAVFSIGLILMGTIGCKVPIFVPRTIFWLSIIPTAWCAAGLAAIPGPRRQWAAVGGVALLVGLNLASAAAHRQTENWDLAIQSAKRMPGSRLIVESEAMGLLLQTACDRIEHGPCRVPIVAVITPDDHTDTWASGLYRGQSVPIDRIGLLPEGRYFVFSKEFYHHLPATLHAHGHARSITGDPPLLGPVSRLALIS